MKGYKYYIRYSNSYDFKKKEGGLFYANTMVAFLHLENILGLFLFLISTLLYCCIFLIVRIFFLFPIYFGWFVFRSIFYIFLQFFKFIFLRLLKSVFLILKRILNVKFLLLLLILKFVDVFLPKNKDLISSQDFWFSSVPRSKNLEIDFLEYNRKFSKLYLRKIFKPKKILIDESLIHEKIYEFKLYLLNNNLKYIDFHFHPVKKNFRISFQGSKQQFLFNPVLSNTYPFSKILRLMYDEKDFQFLGTKLLDTNFFYTYLPLTFFSHSIINLEAPTFNYLQSLSKNGMYESKYFTIRHFIQSFFFEKMINYDLDFFSSFIGWNLTNSFSVKNYNGVPKYNYLYNHKTANIKAMYTIDDLLYSSLKNQYFKNFDISSGGFILEPKQEEISHLAAAEGGAVMKHNDSFSIMEINREQFLRFNPYKFNMFGSNILVNNIRGFNTNHEDKFFFFSNTIQWPVFNEVELSYKENLDLKESNELRRFFSSISESEFNELENEFDFNDEEIFSAEIRDSAKIINILGGFFGRTFPIFNYKIDNNVRMKDQLDERNIYYFLDDIAFDKNKLDEITKLLSISRTIVKDNQKKTILNSFKRHKNRTKFYNLLDYLNERNLKLKNDFIFNERKDLWIEELLLKYNKNYLLSNIPSIRNNFKNYSDLKKIKNEILVSDINKLNPKYLYLTTLKDPFTMLKHKYPLHKKVKHSIWELNYGKYDHELIWKSRTLNPFSIAPTKKRMTSGDYWFLRRGFGIGFMSIQEIYYYLKNDVFIKNLRILETKICFFIFNRLPSEFIFVELKYLFLNYLLQFTFFDQFLVFLTNWTSYDLLEFKWFLIRLVIIISDVFLWYMFAYIKVTMIVFINMFFDDFISIYMYICKILNNHYYIDAYIPLNKSRFLKSRYQFFELLRSPILENREHRGSYKSYYENTRRNVYITKRGIKHPKSIVKTHLKLTHKFLLPERHFGSGAIGKRGDVNRFSSLRYSYIKKWSFRRYPYTARRGNTIIFGFGGKIRSIGKRAHRFFTTYRSIMRFHNVMPYRYHLRPLFFYFPTKVTYKYRFLNFFNYFGLKPQEYKSSFSNLFLLENNFTLFPLLDKEIKSNFTNKINFLEFFNSSLRPLQISKKFKHFYFFNYVRPYKLYDSTLPNLFELNPHYLSSQGIYKSPNFFDIKTGNLVLSYNFLRFKFPFFDFLSSAIIDVDKVYHNKEVRKGIFLRRLTADKRVRFLSVLNFYNYTKIFGYYPFSSKHFFYSWMENHNFFSFKFTKLVGDVFSMYFPLFPITQTRSTLEYKNIVNPFMVERFINQPVNGGPRFLDFFYRFENVSTQTYVSQFDRITKEHLNFHNYIYVPGFSAFSGLYNINKYVNFMPSMLEDYNFFYTFNHCLDFPLRDIAYALFSPRFMDVKNNASFFDNKFSHSSYFVGSNKPRWFSNVSDTKYLSGVTTFFNSTVSKYSDIFNYKSKKDHRTYSNLGKIHVFNKILKHRKYDGTREMIIKTRNPAKQHRKIRIKIFKTQKFSFLIFIFLLGFFKFIYFLFFVFYNYPFYCIFVYFIVLVILLVMNALRLSFTQYFFLFRMLLLINLRNNQFLSNYSVKAGKLGVDYENFSSLKHFKNILPHQEYKKFRNNILFSFFFEIFGLFFYNFIYLLKGLLNYFYGLYIFLTKYLIDIFFVHFKFLNKKKIFKFSFSFLNFFQNLLFIFIRSSFKKILNFFSFSFYLKFIKKIIYYLFKIFHFSFFLFVFSFFLILLNKYLIIHDLYLTQLKASSICIMFIFVVFFIWFLRIISKCFVENFLESKFSIDQYLQNESFDPNSLVNFDNYNFFEIPYEPDSYFDADSFPIYYHKNFFSQYQSYIISLFSNSFWFKKTLKKKKPDDSFLFDSKLSRALLLKFYEEQTFWNINSYKSYKFNNDLSLYHEFEESIKTVSNVSSNVNFENDVKSKKFIKYDLPWDVVSYYMNLDKAFDYFSYALRIEKTNHNPVSPRIEYIADSNFKGIETAGIDYDFPSMNSWMSFKYRLSDDDDTIFYMEKDLSNFETTTLNNYDMSEEYNFKPFVFQYNTIFFNNTVLPTDFKDFFFSNKQEDYSLILKNNNWINEIIVDKFFINLTDENFFFSFKDLVWKSLSNFIEDVDLKKNINDHIFLTNNNVFRFYFYNLFNKLKPTISYFNSIYSVNLNSLYRRNNPTIIQNSKMFYQTPLYKDESIENIDFNSFLLHPHDFVFKFNKRVGIVNFTPYFSKNMLYDSLKITTVSFHSFEFLDNFFKYLFFQNPKFFEKNLMLKNYPELTIEEAERIWITLGCDQFSWNKLDTRRKHINTFDPWEIPLFMSCFLFFTHYYKRGKFRIVKKARKGVYPVHLLSQDLSWYMRGISIKKYKRASYRVRTQQYFRQHARKRTPTYEMNPFEFFWSIFDFFHYSMSTWLLKGKFEFFSFFLNLFKMDNYLLSFEIIFFLIFQYFLNENIQISINSSSVLSHIFLAFSSFLFFCFQIITNIKLFYILSLTIFHSIFSSSFLFFSSLFLICFFIFFIKFFSFVFLFIFLSNNLLIFFSFFFVKLFVFFFLLMVFFIFRLDFFIILLLFFIVLFFFLFIKDYKAKNKT